MDLQPISDYTTAKAGSEDEFTIKVKVCIAPRLGIFSDKKLNETLMHELEVMVRSVLVPLDLRGSDDSIKTNEAYRTSEREFFHEEVSVSTVVNGPDSDVERALKAIDAGLARDILPRYPMVHGEHRKKVA